MMFENVSIFYILELDTKVHNSFHNLSPGWKRLLAWIDS